MPEDKKLKPHLACDIDLDNPGSFPKIAMPKIDGVRGINIAGKMTGRSLDAHANPHITARFSKPEYAGFDGELVTGPITSHDLCRKTSGDCARKSADSHYDAQWWLFDYIGPDAVHLPYEQRLARLHEIVDQLKANDGPSAHPVQIVPHEIIHDVAQLNDFDERMVQAGFEGSIFRDPKGMHKSGRASNKPKSKTGNAYLRLKRFVDFEFEIVEFIEAMENTNEKKINSLGQSERSTHKAGMVPKGMVGMIRGRVLKDVVYMDRLCIEKGAVIDIGPGEMPHEQRVALWEHREAYVDVVGKAKFFPHGQKDKPRFPTFVALRSKEDMS